MQTTITHFLDWDRYADADWEKVMAEFAEHGHRDFVVYDRWGLLLALDAKFPARFRKIRDGGTARLVGAHGPFGSYFDLLADDPEFEPVSRYVHTHLIEMLAGEYGITSYTVHPLNDFLYRGSVDDAKKLLERTLTPILEVAAKNNVAIAIENGLQPIDQPDVLPELVKHFDSPYFGCCCDIGHLNIAAHRRGLDLMQCLEMMYPTIVVAHLHDNDGQRDLHQVAGLGSIDWRRLMPVLARAPRLRSLQNEGIYSYIPVGEICERIDRLQEYAALPMGAPAKNTGCRIFDGSQK